MAKYGYHDVAERSGRRAKCAEGIGVSVAQVQEPPPKVSGRYRSHAVKHEPEFHNPDLDVRLDGARRNRGELSDASEEEAM